MFTGIVEELGRVVSLEDQGDAVRLTVEAPLVAGDAALGDSVAVNGCCLTVAEREGSRFTADVMHQTLELTSLGDLVAESRVNLERAVLPTTRLGGHLVQGHVDGRGEVLRRTPSAHWEVVEVSVPEHLQRYLVPQGSITVDGVSLTVVEVTETSFAVSLIPETLVRTVLGARQTGDTVNLEVDVIAKYVERMVTR